MQAFINNLKKGLEKTLPGQAAQYKMAHVIRKKRLPLVVPDNAKSAAVLVLFYQKDDRPHLVLTKRVSKYPQDKHSGQMSFPGGRYESEDANFGQTALRETEEEIGIPSTKIQLLGALTPLYIPVSNFHVHPYIGFLDESPQFRIQEDEVQIVVETPLDLLQNTETLQWTDIKINPQVILKKVPYFNIFGNIVWGATAMMLSELLAVLNPNNQ